MSRCVTSPGFRCVRSPRIPRLAVFQTSASYGSKSAEVLGRGGIKLKEGEVVRSPKGGRYEGESSSLGFQVTIKTMGGTI